MKLVDDASSYRNPIIDSDVPDPDAIRVGDRFFLVASSFHRTPALPIFESTDLVSWNRVGYALERMAPSAWFTTPRHGGGVWAPSIRHHDGRFFVIYPDPDQGVYVVSAEHPSGPWSEPHLLLPGLGIIDPCPLWDDDGRTYLVHGWARSRSGRKNVLTVIPVDAELRETTGPAVDVIDGAHLDGFTTLEGPKFHKRDGEYWIFAPAGGVATGWQTVFRADSPYGPYEHRIVLAQGDTPVNGPHQGAWVDDGRGGDWFLHFQDRGVYGRVLHLQPMAWGDDGWPVMGESTRGGAAEPVLEHPMPLPGRQVSRTLARSDDFASGAPSIHWQWEADAAAGAIVGTAPRTAPSPESTPAPGLALRGSPDGDNVRTMPRVVSQNLPGQPCTAAVDVALETARPGERAGLAALGLDYLWAGVRMTDATAEAVVAVRTRDDLAERVVATIPLAQPAVRVELSLDAEARVRVRVAGDDVDVRVDPGFRAVEGHWVGASLSLFAAQPHGASEAIGRFAHFTVDVEEHADVR